MKSTEQTEASDPMAEPEPKQTGRDRHGRFSQGNTARLAHGRFSMAVAKALLPEQSELLSILADREAAILVDLGGSNDLMLFERDLVQTYQQLHALKEFSAPSMFRSRGRARQQAIDAFMSAVDRQLKIIQQLGLRRRQKTVETPQEWIARITAEREQREPQPDDDQLQDQSEESR